MLTPRQNFEEMRRGGNPDRFVKQVEFFKITPNPIMLQSKSAVRGAGPVQNAWGVWYDWPEHVVAGFPLHDREHVVIKDITKWRDYVKHPRYEFPEEAWAPFAQMAAQVDKTQYYSGTFFFWTIFEQLHGLMGMTECLMNFYEEPEAMHDLIDYLVDFSVCSIQAITEHMPIDMVYEGDDWGNNKTSFLSPQMFEEFIVPGYKKIVQTWKENGVKLVVHHNDSNSANIVPQMIDIGIDVWQGCISGNNLPELIKKYGDKLVFMGGIDSNKLDAPGWQESEVEAFVRKMCTDCGKHYFIPCLTQGMAMSTYEGLHECVNDKIDLVSKELF